MNLPAVKFYDEAENSDALVWRVCEYSHDCKQCPATETHFNEEGYKRGCRALAEEIIAIVLEAKA